MSSIAAPLPFNPFEFQNQEALSEDDHPPGDDHPLGSEEVVNFCVGRINAYCAEALVAHKPAMTNTARALTLSRKNLFQFFINVPFF
jgi:hypothetical protein